MDGDMSFDSVESVSSVDSVVAETSSEVADISSVDIALDHGAGAASDAEMLADADISIAVDMAAQPTFVASAPQQQDNRSEYLVGDTGFTMEEMAEGGGQINIPIVRQSSSDKAKAYVANILGVPQTSNVSDILKGIYNSRKTESVQTKPAEMPAITVAPPPIAPLIDDELHF